MNNPTGKKHIAYLITRTEIGGAQSHLYELLRHHKNTRLTLISGEDDWLAERARELDVQVIIIHSLTNTLNPITNGLCFIKLRKILKAIKLDLLHIHSSKAGILGRLASMGLRHKTVFTAHGWAFGKNKPKIRHWLALCAEKICAPLCDAIITVSKYDNQLAREMGIAKRTPCMTIHNGVDDTALTSCYLSRPENYNNKTDSDDNRGFGCFVIVTVARLAKPKDMQSLIKAMAIINQNNLGKDPINVRCLIVGDGPDKEALTLLSQKLATQNVEFLGQSNGISEILSKANVFVLISHWEGLPISIIEAMRAGLPIIASNVGGVSELVNDKINGYLLDENHPKLIAEKLQYLIYDKESCSKMGRLSRQHYLQSFHAKRMVDKTHAVYHNLIYNDTKLDNTIT